MRLKYYLRGIGMGMLVTAVILMIAFQQTEKKSMSDEEVIKRAKELGMVDKDSASGNAKYSSMDELLGKTGEKEPEDNVADPKKPSENDGEDGDKNQDKDPVNKPDNSKTDNKKSNNQLNKNQDKNKTDPKKNEEKEQEPVVSYVTLTIGRGDISESIANRLEAAGVIDSASDFNRYLIENGYSTKLQKGTYQIPKDASEHEIAKIITSGD